MDAELEAQCNTYSFFIIPFTKRTVSKIKANWEGARIFNFEIFKKGIIKLKLLCLETLNKVELISWYLTTYLFIMPGSLFVPQYVQLVYLYACA